MLLSAVSVLVVALPSSKVPKSTYEFFFFFFKLYNSL